MNLFYCFLYVFINFLYLCKPAEASRISQQSPVSENRDDDLKKTLMYCKTVTVLLHPEEPYRGVNQFKMLGAPLEKSQKVISNTLDVPPYVGGYLSSFEAPVSNEVEAIKTDISNEFTLDDSEASFVDIDYGSIEEPIEDLDVVGSKKSKILDSSSGIRSSSSRDACKKVCCDAVTSVCDECDCSRGLEKELRRNCNSACRDEF